MKTIVTTAIILIMSLLMASCATVEESNRAFDARGYDFTPYTQEGFMITPLSYAGDYESIGLISVTLWPEVTRSIPPGRQGYTSVFPPGESQRIYIENIETTEVIDTSYSLARDMGADAIINFSVNTDYQTRGGIEVSGISVSGFAIRRLD